jgi:hypothetical protein
VPDLLDSQRALGELYGFKNEELLRTSEELWTKASGDFRSNAGRTGRTGSPVPINTPKWKNQEAVHNHVRPVDPGHARL